MTFLYDAQYSFVLLGPKNEVKHSTLNTKCRQVDLYGEMEFTVRGRFYFSGFRKAQDVQVFSGASFAANAVPEKLSTNGQGGGDEKNKNKDREVQFSPIFGQFSCFGPCF